MGVSLWVERISICSCGWQLFSNVPMPGGARQQAKANVVFPSIPAGGSSEQGQSTGQGLGSHQHHQGAQGNRLLLQIIANCTPDQNKVYKFNFVLKEFACTSANFPKLLAEKV